MEPDGTGTGGRGYQSGQEAVGCSNGRRRGQGRRSNKNNLLESQVMKYNTGYDLQKGAASKIF